MDRVVPGCSRGRGFLRPDIAPQRLGYATSHAPIDEPDVPKIVEYLTATY